MEKGYSKYNYICSQSREKEVYLYPKECYPILESFILNERFWSNELL